jgi:molybdopterin molybdotransferase
LIGYEEAVRLIAERTPPLEAETVPLERAGGRFLAEPLVARLDSPGFDNSAVDGYAVRGQRPYRIVGSVAAGQSSEAHLQPGQAVRILTGAPVPPGTESVVMQEDVEVDSGRLCVNAPIKPGSHIRRRGEEYRAGDFLLKSGIAVSPAVVANLASNGLDHVAVGRAPRVAILATGDELVRPGQPLGKGQIYNSNAPSLSAAARLLGCSVRHFGIQRDDLESTASVLQEALEASDVVVTTGGVSVGDRDLVRPALATLGVEEVFWKVAIKPGKPVVFGTSGSKMVFGLPGNPVSALVTFFLFVRPALMRLMGAVEPSDERFTAELACDLRKQPGRTEFVRAKRDGQKVVPTEGQGSHMLGGLVQADCLIYLASELTKANAGDTVEAILLNWGVL